MLPLMFSGLATDIDTCGDPFGTCKDLFDLTCHCLLSEWTSGLHRSDLNKFLLAKTGKLFNVTDISRATKKLGFKLRYTTKKKIGSENEGSRILWWLHPITDIITPGICDVPVDCMLDMDEMGCDLKSTCRRQGHSLPGESVRVKIPSASKRLNLIMAADINIMKSERIQYFSKHQICCRLRFRYQSTLNLLIQDVFTAPTQCKWKKEKSASYLVNQLGDIHGMQNVVVVVTAGTHVSGAYVPITFERYLHIPPNTAWQKISTGNSAVGAVKFLLVREGRQTLPHSDSSLPPFSLRCTTSPSHKEHQSHSSDSQTVAPLKGIANIFKMTSAATHCVSLQHRCRFLLALMNPGESTCANGSNSSPKDGKRAPRQAHRSGTSVSLWREPWQFDDPVRNHQFTPIHNRPRGSSIVNRVDPTVASITVTGKYLVSVKQNGIGAMTPDPATTQLAYA
ncbi:hypothetical protein Pelo_9637 [Pelomyxa schiedti]|nr:hypothetical protein Pelo_9637 [Pelomyxa schiedti]